MLSFLKVFGRGIVVTILLPFILLLLAFYMVYCLVLFVVMFFKDVIGFFRGNNFNADLPEDLEARRIVLEKEKVDSNAKDMLNMMYQQTMAQAAFNAAAMQQQMQGSNPIFPEPTPSPAIDVKEVEQIEEQPEQQPEQPDDGLKQPDRRTGKTDPERKQCPAVLGLGVRRFRCQKPPRRGEFHVCTAKHHRKCRDEPGIRRPDGPLHAGRQLL